MGVLSCRMDVILALIYFMCYSRMLWWVVRLLDYLPACCSFVEASWHYLSEMALETFICLLHLSCAYHFCSVLCYSSSMVMIMHDMCWLLIYIWLLSMRIMAKWVSPCRAVWWLDRVARYNSMMFKYDFRCLLCVFCFYLMEWIYSIVLLWLNLSGFIGNSLI